MGRARAGSCAATMVVVMMAMVTAAQGGEGLGRDVVHPASPSTEDCLLKCGDRCRPKFRLIFRPPSFGLCYLGCMIGCKISPFDNNHVIGSCTANCANSMLHAHDPDSEKIGDYLKSCYQGCLGK